MADPTKFLLNTDYEMDKIVYFTQGELNAGQYDVRIKHNLGFTPLIFGTCSPTSDFSESYSIPLDYQTQNNTEQFNAAADSTNIRLSYINYNGDPPKMYYRIYGFEPAGSSTKVGPTSNKAKKFVLNTDYNYCKLFKKGTVPGNVNTNVEHNLGYTPQVLTWFEVNGIIEPLTRADWGNIDGSQNFDSVVVTDSLVRFECTLYQYDKIHYRIYYDEA